MRPGEKFNTISHLIPAILAVPGLVYLVLLAAATGDAWKIVSVSVYGVTLLLLYCCSSLCHGYVGKHERLFEKLDHLAIYLLIAGTCTPYLLVTLRGAWGWSMFGIVWSLALIGMAVDLWPRAKDTINKRRIPLIIYLIMGWVMVIPLKPLAEKLAENGLIWLIAGGLLYTVGVIFFVLSDKFKHAHGIWHLFVVGGSVSHYISISAFVI